MRSTGLPALLPRRNLDQLRELFLGERRSRVLEGNGVLDNDVEADNLVRVDGRLGKEVIAHALGHGFVTLVAKERLPAIYEVQEFVNVGGLMSYGYNVNELYRRAANHLDRIFKGARPAELPVEQPTMFELVINLNAAGEIGLKVSQSLLLRADRVIA